MRTIFCLLFHSNIFRTILNKILKHNGISWSSAYGGKREPGNCSRDHYSWHHQKSLQTSDRLDCFKRRCFFLGTQITICFCSDHAWQQLRWATTLIQSSGGHFCVSELPTFNSSSYNDRITTWGEPRPLLKLPARPWAPPESGSVAPTR